MPQVERDAFDDILGIGDKATPWWRSWRAAILMILLLASAVAGGYVFLASGNTSQNIRYKTEADLPPVNWSILKVSIRGLRMATKRDKPEKIVSKLCQVDVQLC